MLRFVTYKTLSNLSRVNTGIYVPKPNAFANHVLDGEIYNLLDITGRNGDMQAVIQSHKEIAPILFTFLNKVDDYKNVAIPVSKVQLLAPLPLPKRNVICVGKNYKDHVAEVARADKTAGIGSTSAPTPEYPKYPQFFTKAPNAVIGPNEEIESHSELTSWLDYEAELAVVIGKKGRDIPRDQVDDHIFGYTIGNDVCARDIQRHHGQWFKGKTLDTTCPMGPAILYHNRNEFNPQNLAVRLWVNGEKRQDSNTNNMIFDIHEVIHQLSKGFTLYPGDVILTGTPDGVGYAMKPPKCLKAGDKIKIEIEGIGILENSVR
jgi:2-keto-4-pentenoate hydratase/2-oxohepta-3-ene-1,7-dioic acid hydratase in catechol pathway